MHGGQGHMDCVRRGHGRDDLIFEQSCDQGIGRIDHPQPGEAFKHGEAFGGKGGIAVRGLVEDSFRDEQLEILPARLPPFLGRLLVRRQPQVPAAPRH